MEQAGIVQVQHRGTAYRASFAVKKGRVHIVTTIGRKPPQELAGLPPRVVARAMLKELLKDRDEWSESGL
jgi:hypothetical protein